MIATPTDPRDQDAPREGYMTQGSPSMTITIPDSPEQAVFAIQA